jgi:hypothetical protein
MSSKRAIRRRGCEGKQRHESIGRAWAAMQSLVRSGKIYGTVPRPYRCQFCHGWHLGHMPRKLSRRANG